MPFHSIPFQLHTGLGDTDVNLLSQVRSCVRTLQPLLVSVRISTKGSGLRHFALVAFITERQTAWRFSMLP